MTRARRIAAATPARAFTLVEMLIVIGVILLLTALTVMVTAGFVRSSEVREIENTMSVLETALKEWEIAADRQISYGVGGAYDVDQQHIETSGSAPTFHYDDTIFDLVGIINRTAAARDVLANIDPEFLLKLPDPDDPSLERTGIRDPWDTTIRAIFPGRLWVQGQDAVGIRNDDGTIRTALEIVHGIAVDRRILFVSAGPDGQWGNLHLDVATSSLSPAQRADVEAAADNVYSYEPLRTRP